MTTQEIELSERLRKACLEKGITEPRFVAQDADGWWIHYNEDPACFYKLGFFANARAECQELFCDETTAENWRETLMEFVKPTIEEGKRYWRRDGSVSGVIYCDYGFTDGGNSYWDDGAENLGVIGDNDVIAEYKGEPLSEVLKRTCEHCGKMIDGSDEIV